MLASMGVSWLAPPEMMSASLKQWVNSARDPAALLRDLLEVALTPETLHESLYSRVLTPHFPNRAGFPARELAMAMTNVIACHLSFDTHALNQHLLAVVDALIAIAAREGWSAPQNPLRGGPPMETAFPCFGTMDPLERMLARHD
jgi:hypothetical protein